MGFSGKDGGAALEDEGAGEAHDLGAAEAVEDGGCGEERKYGLI